MVPHHVVKGDGVGWGKKKLRILKGDRSVEKER